MVKNMKNLKKIVYLLIAMLPVPVLAQGIYPACFASGTPCGLCDVLELAITITDFIFSVSGAVALLFIVISGIALLTSAGNKEKIDWGKKTFFNALFGLMVVLFAFTGVNYVIYLLTQEEQGGIATIARVPWSEVPCVPTPFAEAPAQVPTTCSSGYEVGGSLANTGSGNKTASLTSFISSLQSELPNTKFCKPSASGSLSISISSVTQNDGICKRYSDGHCSTGCSGLVAQGTSISPSTECCWHACSASSVSCHYGGLVYGKTWNSVSEVTSCAVDLVVPRNSLTQENYQRLIQLVTKLGGRPNYEGDHLHVSVTGCQGSCR